MAFEEFLDVIEAIDISRDLSARNLWTRDEPEYGTSITSGRQVRQNIRNPRQQDAYKRALVECVRLIDRVRSGALPDLWLREAMSTSDFPILFGDVIDRTMLGNYAEAPSTWRNYIRQGTVRDFRPARNTYLEGGEAVLDEVKELAEYKASNLREGQYSRQVKKYGRRMPFSFESMINDDQNQLTQTPQRFARASRRSEQRFAVALYAGPSGPKSTLYTVGNKNIITGNPAFSFDALAAALRQLGSMVDSDGEPIVVEMAELVVPPALEFEALRVLNTTEITVTVGDREERSANYLRNKVRVNVEPYLPIISSTANGDTSWYLFAPANSERPAIEFDFLRGFEQPQLFMRAPNAIRVGGGASDPMQGDFDHDAIDYKVRHIFGGGYLDPRGTLASNGTGV
jgi:hypothetical protein